MKLLTLIVFLTLASGVFAQAPEARVLATANGISFTADDLSQQGRTIYLRSNEILAANRSKFLEQTIAELLIKTEADARGISSMKLLSDEFAKIPRPSDERIADVIEMNREALAGLSPAEARERVLQEMLREPSAKAEAALIESLKTRYKFTQGKDINDATLMPSDVIFTMNAKPFTAAMFNDMNRVALNDVEVHIYEEIRGHLEDAILNRLIITEAASQKLDSSELVKLEISDKMVDGSDRERAVLVAALQEKLFKKHGVKLLLPEPTALVLNVSADDDPSSGPANAKVTIVTFIDYQCSACAGFSPVIKKVAAEFGQRVRLVVRDYPLMSIHPNAFNAALAANAAGREGKYFEYGDLLYANQDSLDDASLLKYATQLGLDAAKFKADIADPKNAQEVKKDMADGDSYGVSGTPTIYINGVKHHGLSETRFRQAVEKALGGVK
jgi:protein-disulfide isomerase